MNAKTARLELLSATLQAIAAALPREDATLVAQHVRASAEDLSKHVVDVEVDAAIAGEAGRLLASLESLPSGTACNTPAPADSVGPGGRLAVHRRQCRAMAASWSSSGCP